MSGQIPQETSRSVERELTHSRHVIANAKVVVTFSAALAGTFASAAMDPNEHTSLDEWAMGLMLATLAVTVVVIFLRSRHRRSDEKLTDDPSRKTALLAYGLMVVQVILSVATIAVAIDGKRHTDDPSARSNTCHSIETKSTHS